ncbi:MAG: hypothetical protein NVSMB6_22680 [Burkholderiaceae bacterium]
MILKPGYAPIEQYADMASVPQGPWTDIYALASVIHYAIMGRAPAPSVSRILSDRQVPLTQSAAARYSEGFLRTIDRCLAVQPQDRPQSVKLLRAELRLASDLTAQPPADHTPPTVEKAVPTVKAPRWNKKRASSLAGGAFLIILGGAAFLMTRAPSRPGLPGDVTQPTPKRLSNVLPSATAPIPESSQSTERPPAAAHEARGAPSPALTPERGAPSSRATDALGVLEQVYDARDPSHIVQVSLAKKQVRIGVDKLQMRITSAKPGYLYLLMVGTNRSDFTLLFPNAADRNNRISAGKAIALPRAGWRLGAFGPPGVDQFVVMVSDRPRSFSNAGLRQGELFGEFPPDFVARAAPITAHSPPVFAGIAECAQETGTACPATYGAAKFSISEVTAK